MPLVKFDFTLKIKLGRDKNLVEAKAIAARIADLVAEDLTKKFDTQFLISSYQVELGSIKIFNFEVSIDASGAKKWLINLALAASIAASATSMLKDYSGAKDGAKEAYNDLVVAATESIESAAEKKGHKVEAIKPKTPKELDE